VDEEPPRGNATANSLLFIIIIIYFFKVLRDALTEASPSMSSTQSSAKPSEDTGEESSTDREEMPKPADEEMLLNDNDERTENPEEPNASSCASCVVLEGDNRKLGNQVKSLQCKLEGI